MDQQTLEGIARIVVVFFVGSMMLSPVIAFSVRHALKPLTEVVLKLRAAPRQDDQRLALLEEDLHTMQQQLQRLLEGQEFQRKLLEPAD